MRVCLLDMFYMLFFFSLVYPPLLAVTLVIGPLWVLCARNRAMSRRQVIRARLETKQEEQLIRALRSF